MTRDDAKALLDSLSDEGLTRLISELMWFQVTRKGVEQASGSDVMRTLKRLMCNAAKEHCIDALTLEPRTEPLPVQVSKREGLDS